MKSLEFKKLIATPKILMIDDDPDDVSLVKWALQKNNLDVELIGINDGFKAMDYLFQNNETENTRLPDLILLDLNLPAIKGTKILAKIRASDLTKLIPVIIFTTSKNPVDIEDCYRLHANTFVSKPSSGKDLCETLNSICQYWFLTAA